MKDIIILGAGVIGVTSAYMLARAGHKVRVIEAESGPALDTSFANGGQLSYSKTWPLSNPATLRELPKYLFGKNTPLHIKAGFDLQFLRWGLSFLNQSTSAKAFANNEAVTRLGLKSREVLHEIITEHKINFDLEQKGKIYVYTSKKQAEKAREYLKIQNELGIDWRMISVDEALELEPALADMKDELVAASYCSIDESGDAQKFTAELAKICEGMGVEFLYNTKIEGLEFSDGKVESINTKTSNLKAETYICCLGAYSPILLRPLGVHLPIYPMKGYSITVKAGNLAPILSVTDEGRRLVYSKLGGRLRVAGIAEFTGYDKSIDRKIMDGLIADAKTAMPSGGDYSEIEEWIGLRPMTASTVPIIEQAEGFENLYLNTGHGMLGWTLACGSAAELGAIISDT